MNNPQDKTLAAEQLGLEFATWMLAMSVRHSGRIVIEGLEEFDLWFEGALTLIADYGDATSITLKGGNPPESPEARRALREGKKVAKAGLRINWRDQTFTFTFNALTFTMAGLKLPPLAGGPAVDTLLLRLDTFEGFESFFGDLYNKFLEIRLNTTKWKAETARITEWIKGGKVAA